MTWAVLAIFIAVTPPILFLATWYSNASLLKRQKQILNLLHKQKYLYFVLRRTVCTLDEKLMSYKIFEQKSFRKFH